jgi:hypothetical protein
MVFAVGLWIFGVGLLGVLVFVLWIAAFVDLFRRTDLDGRRRWAWVVIVALLPMVGSLAYFVRRPLLDEEREQIIEAETRRH